jgi:hypothetical protein
MDKEKRPGAPGKDDADVEEVVSDFGDARVRSQFEIVEQGPGVLGINIFGPFLEFGDGEDDDLEEHGQPES